MAKAIFEIFRTGKHNGTGKDAGKEWREEDVKQIAQLYNPKTKTAVLRINHTRETTAPKYGEIHRLLYSKGALFAEATVNNELIQKIKNGFFSGISAGFDGLHSSTNPIKGIGFYLDHIAFLEKGQNPAVKNMLPPEISVEGLFFNENSEIHLLEFSENQENNLEQLHQKASFISNALEIDYKTALNLFI